MTGRPHALTEKQRAEVRRRRAKGESAWQLAKAFGVSKRTVENVIAGVYSREGE